MYKKQINEIRGQDDLVSHCCGSNKSMLTCYKKNHILIILTLFYTIYLVSLHNARQVITCKMSRYGCLSTKSYKYMTRQSLSPFDHTNNKNLRFIYVQTPHHYIHTRKSLKKNHKEFTKNSIQFSQSIN